MNLSISKLTHAQQSFKIFVVISRVRERGQASKIEISLFYLSPYLPVLLHQPIEETYSARVPVTMQILRIS